MPPIRFYGQSDFPNGKTMRESEEEFIESLHDDVNKRQYRQRAPQRMTDVVSRLFARRGYARVQSAMNYAERWQAAVGDSISRQTRVGNLRQGILEVVVSNSIVVQELSFQKAQIIRRVNEGLTENAVRDLRFRVGSIA